MKKWMTILMLNAMASLTFAQQFEKPDEGAKIYLSAYELDMTPSDEVKLDIWVVRSNKARKSKFDAPKLLGDKSLEVSLEQDVNDKDHYVASIKSDNVQKGTYFYTVSSRSRSIQKVKGTTLSVNVGSEKTLSKNN